MPILRAFLRRRHVELAGKPEAGQVRVGGGAARCRRSGKRPRLGLEEDAARARSFLLGEATLLRGIHGRLDRRGDDRLSAILRAQDGAAQVARQRWSKPRAGIVARQPGESIGRGPVGGGIEFLVAGAGIAGLQRVDQGAAEADRRDQADPRQRLAGQSGDAGRVAAQTHRRRGVTRTLFCLKAVRIVRAGHYDGLPSLREILIFCWRSPLPRRSSAAPKRRSTIRTFW